MKLWRQCLYFKNWKFLLLNKNKKNCPSFGVTGCLGYIPPLSYWTQWIVTVPNNFIQKTWLSCKRLQSHNLNERMKAYNYLQKRQMWAHIPSEIKPLQPWGYNELSCGAQHQHPIRLPVQVLPAPLLVRFPASAAGKQTLALMETNLDQLQILWSLGE